MYVEHFYGHGRDFRTCAIQGDRSPRTGSADHATDLKAIRAAALHSVPEDATIHKPT